MSSPVLFKSSSGSIHRIAAFWNTYIAYLKKKQQQITTSNFLCLINTIDFDKIDICSYFILDS